MNLALKEAKKAYKLFEVPIGSVLVDNNKIIATGYNKVETNKSPLAHSELETIKKAVKVMGYKHLNDCTLYVTLEPCSMCAGAIILSRIKRVVFGTFDLKAGAAGSIYNILNDSRLNHRCEVTSGVLSEECSTILSNFFVDLRVSKHNK